MPTVAVDDEPTLARARRDRHPERVEQRQVVLGRSPQGGEVVADDQRVRAREQSHRLELAEHAFASSREANPCRRQHQPEERDRLQRLARREQRSFSERGARPRVEQVHRNLARFERRELEREVDALLQRLTHPNDAAATEFHADLGRQPRGRDSVVVRVRRADLGEHRAAGLEVVVVATHAPGGETFSLVAGEQPERARDNEPGFLPNGLHRVEDLGEEPFFRSAHRDDDAELGRTRVARGARGGEDLLEIEERIDVDVGVEASRLRAERAVFRARTRLAVDQALQLDFGAAVRESHPVGERHQCRQLVEWDLRDLLHLVAGEHPVLVEQSARGMVDHGGGAHGGQASQPVTVSSVRALVPNWHAIPVGCSRIPMATVDRPTRAATHMSVATLASRGIGFVRVWVIAAVLGTTFLGNAYQSSSSVSNVLFELLAAGALSAVLVPSFVQLLNRRDDAEAERLAAGLLGLGLAVMGVVCVVGVVLAPQIADVLATGVRDPHVEQQQVALSTFLLRFFVPQVLLYVLGTVATAILYAKRRFVVTAVAPIANTVVVVGALVIFRVVAGPHPGLDLTLTEKLILALGGLLGVAGFVGVPVVALVHSGFRFWPSFVRPDAQLRRVLHLSAWAVLQHAGIGILLGTAIVMGNRVEGGVVAYQFAFVAFMAAYSILAQPVHTTILPDISLDANRGDTSDFADRVRWALDRMAILVLPVSAAYFALALPAMKVIAPASSSPRLLAAALASLGVGLFFYSAFLLLARAFYALGDSRTPALVALGSAVFGAAVEIIGVQAVHRDTTRVAMLGAGHSAAYLVGACVLFVILRVRLGHRLFPQSFWRALLVSAVLGAGAWGVERAIQPRERLATAAVLVMIVVLGLALYVAMLRMLPRRGARREAALEPTDPDVAVEL